MRDLLFYVLLMFGCTAQAIVFANYAEDRTITHFFLYVVMTLIVVIGCSCHAQMGGHHYAWGLLGTMNVLGMLILIFLDRSDDSSEAEARGFDVIPMEAQALARSVAEVPEKSEV